MKLIAFAISALLAIIYLNYVDAQCSPACPSDQFCVSGKCKPKCLYPATYDPTLNGGKGGCNPASNFFRPCGQYQICRPGVGLSCQNAVCVCGTGFAWRYQPAFCDYKTWRESCYLTGKTLQYCNQTSGLICTGGLCGCPTGKTWNKPALQCV